MKCTEEGFAIKAYTITKRPHKINLKKIDNKKTLPKSDLLELSTDFDCRKKDSKQKPKKANRLIQENS